MQEDRIHGKDAPLAGSTERSGGLPARGVEPDPEVLARATRGRFTAEYKAAFVRRLAQAYPIYQRGYEQALGPLDAWIAGRENLLSCGRQGLFATHVVED